VLADRSVEASPQLAIPSSLAVDWMRHEAAQQMIDSSSLGLKEIADACGFGSADRCAGRFYGLLA
jgi:transcriptional regulator GlxA family with amidase domain